MNPRQERTLRTTKYKIEAWQPRSSLCFACVGLLLAVMLGVFSGCQQAGQGHMDTPVGTFANPPATGTNASPSTRFQPGDVLKVAFESETNMTTLATIQLDGTVVLPLVGEVKATGKTQQELRQDLMALYKPLLVANELTVSMAKSAASVYVSGAVLRPGRIPMDRTLTAMEAVMEAGGFDPNRANPSRVTVLRMENGQQKLYKINLKKAMKEGDSAPFTLAPFDILNVPEKTFNF